MAIYRGPGGAGDATNDASSQAIIATQAAQEAEAAKLEAQAYAEQVKGVVEIKSNQFTGDGSTTSFVLSAAPANKTNVIVEVDGVVQQTSSYSVSGSTLTFTEAPYNGAAIETRIISNTGTLNSAQAENVSFYQAGSGAVARDVQSKLRETVSVKDFGAVGDGVTDDTAAFLASNSNATSEIYVPEGVYFCTTLTPNQITKKLTGPGFTIFGGDYQDHRVNQWAYVYSATPPATWSNAGDPALAMSGTMVGKAGVALQTYITGTNTAGIDATGYHTRTDLAPCNLNMVFSSGHNEQTGDTNGRTGVPQYSSNIVHLGAGDLFHFAGGGYVNNPNPFINTHWLADPAITVLAGGVSTVTDSANLVGSELTVRDNGHNVTASGYSIHLDRTATIPVPIPKEYVWLGYAVTSDGAIPIDAMYVGVGKSRIGIDFSKATFSDNNTAIALKAGQRINLNSTNTSWINTPDKTTPGAYSLYYDSASTALVADVPNLKTASIRPGDGTPIWTSGSGSPQGVVTAVVGSMYTRTDGGANTTLYIKESGTGNTGWVAK